VVVFSIGVRVCNLRCVRTTLFSVCVSPPCAWYSSLRAVQTRIAYVQIFFYIEAGIVSWFTSKSKIECSSRSR